MFKGMRTLLSGVPLKLGLRGWLLVAFLALHVFMVLVSGVWNNIRSMITGRYAIQIEGKTA